jgi:hypothetical protein
MVESLILIALILVVLLPLSSAGGDNTGAIEFQAEHCRLTFDRGTGALTGVTNLLTGDNYLKRAGAAPFRIYSGFTKEFELNDDPAATSGLVSCRLARVGRRGGLSLSYEGDGLAARLRITPAEPVGATDWSLRVTNTGEEAREIMVSFPCFEGVQLGPPGAENLAAAMQHAGVVVPAWGDYRGGVVGNGGQVSMQWHAIWDPVSRGALGLIMMDPRALPKMLNLVDRSIEVRYFPPRRLAPGQTMPLPAARLLVYRGDWRPAARAYRKWFDRAYTCVQPPEWFRHSDGIDGRHFPYGRREDLPDFGAASVRDSFAQLPAMHLRLPIDNLEYAFYSRGSMLHGVHTDGDNIIREDLGGAAAMKKGLAGVHRLGLHATLYVEGYIVHEQSDLARSGKAERWSVMHKDGSITGGYTGQGFYHMCPGCVEWQDHLARTVKRLLRETGADGVRLDSLGFYFLPCYNPAHDHATPFGYNDWVKQLLAKVRRAALSVNPNALLTTEAPVDWWGQWFHGALTQVYPRDPPPMRLAVGPYRPYVYAPGGVVWGAISGLPGGRTCWEPDLERLEGNWLCAQAMVHAALVWGDVADEDPLSSDPEIVTRRFEGSGYWAVAAVRPATNERFIWPASTGLSDHRADYTITLPGLASRVEDVVVCDVETLAWTEPALSLRLRSAASQGEAARVNEDRQLRGSGISTGRVRLHRRAGDLVLRLRTNFALAILRRRGGPTVVGLDELPQLHPGDSTTVRIAALSGGEAQRARVVAPGLRVTPQEVSIPGEVGINVPADAFPGLYGIRVEGKNILGMKRFLAVR